MNIFFQEFKSKRNFLWGGGGGGGGGGGARNFLSDKLVLQGKFSQKFTRPYEKFTCPASQG